MVSGGHQAGSVEEVGSTFPLDNRHAPSIRHIYVSGPLEWCVNMTTVGIQLCVLQICFINVHQSRSCHIYEHVFKWVVGISWEESRDPRRVCVLVFELESRKQRERQGKQRGERAEMRILAQATVSQAQEHKQGGVCCIWLSVLLAFIVRFQNLTWEQKAKLSGIN